MPKFSIAFVVPSKENLLKHKIIEGEDKDTVLKTFFAQEAKEYYSNDEQGFYYFKEDFADPATAAGSIIPCE